jgi:signal transduction histidine kinase
MLPACLLLAINALWITNPILWIRQCAALIVTFGLVHPALLLIGGMDVFEYLEIGMLEAILGTSLVIGLPVRWSVPIIFLFGLTFGACTLYLESDSSPFVNFCVDFAVYAFLGIAASYRYEDISRREFVAQARSRKEYAERIAADADRRRWLEVIAGFLRHELKNSITAISTSIEIADRVAPQSEAGKYLDRGRRSVQYMRLLLDKVADATNLESALAQHEFESIDLSSLIAGRVEDFRADTPGRVFSTDIEPDVRIFGHSDSLTQLLDKLMNNAVEHGDPQFPIHIALKNRVESCQISVSDVGDPLPADATRIFEPFVTRKTARPGAAHLGLGLFVARAIAVNHGGTIQALADPAGACFLVDLPLRHGALSPESTDSRDPARFESGRSLNHGGGRLRVLP